jgi:hypothetical protein
MKMGDKFIDLLASNDKAISACKGKVYRGKRNAFINAKGEYVYQERMLPLKRQSCSGCEKCGWMDDELPEFISNDTLPIIHQIEDGATYRLSVVDESRDWESGQVDDWDFEFVKINENKVDKGDK